MGNWVARPDQLLSPDSLRLFCNLFLPWLVGWLFLACEGVLGSRRRKERQISRSVSPVPLFKWRVK